MPRPTPWWFRSSKPSRATSPKAACCSAKCAGKPLFRLKFDPLVGALEIDLERLAQAVRVIPHAAEYRKLDDLLLAGQIADPSPLPGDSVVDLAGFLVRLLRLDHSHARHCDLPSTGLLRLRTLDKWCRVRDLNSRPTVYKTAALPLS